MSGKVPIRNVVSLAVNLLLVYVAYTACRLAFVWTNGELYGGLSWPRLFELLRAGLVFDSSAIFYTNLLTILMFLLPLHWKERRGYYVAARWIYVIVNALCIATNLCDAVYFPFTGKRTTASVMQEFGNEGAGQLASIFAEHALANWWLVVAFVLLTAMLWACFVNPCKPPKRSRHVRYVYENHSERPSARQLWGYYAGQVVALCAVGYLSVGMMRGGFTTAVRPITISNANQYVDTPNEAGVVLNTPFSLIRTFGKKAFVVPEYMSEAREVELFDAEKGAMISTDSTMMILSTDSTFSTDSTLSTMTTFSTLSTMSGLSTISNISNVVVLIVESFSKQHIGFYNRLHNENGADGDKHTFTPFLDSLLTHSLTFRYSYSNGRKSIEGMPSVLSSIPNFVEPFFLTPASMNKLSGLARELSENKGYTSAFFHGAENGSMGFEAFARSTGFQKYYGRTEYNADPRYGGDADFDGTWAIWDEPFLQFYCDQMSAMPEPFITSVFTASSHSPFKVPAQYEGKFAKGRMPLQECVTYTDYALRMFFNKAKRQPWYDRTLFVLTSDHTSSHFDPHYTTTLGSHSVPIAFFAPGMPSLCGYNDSTIVEQIDIMPTVLGLLGYDRPYIAFGQDILSTPSRDKFAIHWLPETSSYEFLRGDLLIRFDGRDITAAYNFRRDPLLKKNLLATLPPADLAPPTDLMKAIIQHYMRRMNDNRLTTE